MIFIRFTGFSRFNPGNLFNLVKIPVQTIYRILKTKVDIPYRIIFPFFAVARGDKTVFPFFGSSPGATAPFFFFLPHRPERQHPFVFFRPVARGDDTGCFFFGSSPKATVFRINRLPYPELSKAESAARLRFPPCFSDG
jgi:hypothetical protein